MDAQYTELYGNTYLKGTAKTNLQSAKTAYNTAHTNLINAINTAISDKKVTDAESSNVDSKFTAYGTALGTYKTRVEEANKAIQDELNRQAQEKVDAVQIGSRNLITNRQNIITSGSDNTSYTTYVSELNNDKVRETTVTCAKTYNGIFPRYVFLK